MRLFTGSLAAGLVLFAAGAQAQVLVPHEAGRSPYAAVSDFDSPYAAVPPGVPGPRYGSGPSLLPSTEVYAVLRDNGFSPLGIPRLRGFVYTIAVLDRGGEDGRLVIDGRNGRIIRFVPASQWGQTYDRMSFGHGAGMAPLAGPAGTLPPTTRINVAPSPPASIPSAATRAAVPLPAQRPVVAAPQPAQPVQQSAVNEAKPAPPPQMAGTVGEAKPSAPAIKPSQAMPPVQALE